MNNSFKKSSPILLCAVMMYMLIIICPIVDLYMPWYMTLLPVIIMILYLFRNRAILSKAISILLIGLTLTLFQYWFIKRGDIFSFTINGIITWIPCVITILCFSQINYKSQKTLLQLALLAMAFTSITTILGLTIYPKACRELASAAQPVRDMYMMLNIGGFDFIYALVLSLPVIFWMITGTKGVMKILNIGVLFTMVYCIYKSEYAAALIIALVILILLIYDTYPHFRKLIVLVAVLFFIMAGSGSFSDIFMWLSSIVESEYVADRLLQVGLVLQGQAIENIDTETTNDRLLLMKEAWNGFLKSPFWGNNLIHWHKDVLSGHSLLLDILSSAGILGLIFFISLFYKVYHKLFQTGFKTLIFNTRIIWFGFICLSLMNPSTFPIIYLVLFTFSSIINNSNRVY